MRALWFLLVPGTALAVPTHLVHQGRLFGPGGEPLAGTYELRFTIYGSETSTTALWTQSLDDVPVDGGTYAVTLGDAVPIDGTVLQSPDLWLGVEVLGGVGSLSRQRLASVLSARTADHIPVEGAAGATTCTDAGRIAWDTSLVGLRVCDGTRWRVMSTRPFVLQNGATRTWSDGTLAASCNGYLNPPSGYVYDGAVGSGTYRIDPCGFVVSNGPSTLVYDAGSYNGCPTNNGFAISGTAAFGDRFLNRSTPLSLAANSRVAYYEDWVNSSESDNGGQHFVDVWVR